jgi:hypothetical protein
MEFNEHKIGMYKLFVPVKSHKVVIGSLLSSIQSGSGECLHPAYKNQQKNFTPHFL